jgi:hypothetical protein
MSTASQGLPVLDGLLGVKRRKPSWFTIAWRWRYELTIIPALTFFTFQLWRRLGLIGSVGILLALILAIAVPGPLRRFVTTRFWCLVTPHRLRTGCAQARIYTRHGKLPAILWTRPIPAGERLWVWCRAGTYPEQFEQYRENLRAALFARDIRVQRSTRFSHVVTVDVIRRDTLGPQRTISSRLGPTTVARQPAFAMSGRVERSEPPVELARIIPGEVIHDD